jgi:hypothetical protein
VPVDLSARLGARHHDAARLFEAPHPGRSDAKALDERLPAFSGARARALERAGFVDATEERFERLMMTSNTRPTEPRDAPGAQIWARRPPAGGHARRSAPTDQDSRSADCNEGATIRHTACLGSNGCPERVLAPPRLGPPLALGQVIMVQTARLFAPTTQQTRQTNNTANVGNVAPVVTKDAAAPTGSPDQIIAGGDSSADVRKFMQNPGKVEAKADDKASLAAARAQANASRGANAGAVRYNANVPSKADFEKNVQGQVDQQIAQLKKDGKIPQDVSVQAHVTNIKKTASGYDVSVQYTASQPGNAGGQRKISFGNGGSAEGPDQTDVLAQTLAQTASDRVAKEFKQN